MLAYESIPNLPTLFFERASVFKDIPFLWAKSDGRWRPSTWKQVADRVTKFAYGLKQLGVKPGDRILLVSENRPEWMIADLAIMSIGAIAVPAYTTNTVGNHRHIIQDSGATLGICSLAPLSQRVMQAAEGSDLKTLITMEWPGSLPQGLKLHGWDDVLGMAERTKGISVDALAKDALAIKRDAMAAIIYTSGTSAEPTGVMLSHGNMLCNVMGAEEFLHTLPDMEQGQEVFLSFLPLSHSYEHTAGQFVPISIGAQIYYAESIEKLAQNIIEVQPTIMTAVPRLYENMRSKILRGAASVGGLKEKMLLRTVDLGTKKYEVPGSLTLLEKIQDAALSFLVRRKVKQRFGGRLKAFVSGGAPLNYDVGLFFISLGLRILQGYGQTESAPVVSVNRVEMNDLTTVGPPLVGVEVKIAEDGEILVRGELVMLGYWNDPDRTAQTIRDGWLHTGDIGELDSKGRIRITDRKKDIIVNSGGDNISPQRIEGVIALQPEIGQVMVYGDKRPHIVALIVPDPDWVKQWRRDNNKGSGSDWQSLLDDTSFEKAVRAAVDRANADLSVIEKIRRILIAEEPFSVENGMLTPSMKCRRHIVKQSYQDRLEALYGKA